MARKKRHKPHEEHASEAWLLPYSDLLTLLLALFIVLFAVSQTDQDKVTEMAQAFRSAFNTGGPSMFDQAGPNVSRAASTPDNADSSDKEYVQENQQLEEVKHELDGYIKANGLEGELSTAMTEEGLMIRIKEQALFPSGSAELVGDSQKIGPVIAGLLATLPQRVVISGHTDNIPIATDQFPSNWELSSQRAMNFMKFILSQNNKLQPARFSAVGHSEYKPVADNNTEAGRSKNRRVEVLISRAHQSGTMKTIQ